MILKKFYLKGKYNYLNKCYWLRISLHYQNPFFFHRPTKMFLYNKQMWWRKVFWFIWSLFIVTSLLSSRCVFHYAYFHDCNYLIFFSKTRIDIFKTPLTWPMFMYILFLWSRSSYETVFTKWDRKGKRKRKNYKDNFTSIFLMRKKTKGRPKHITCRIAVLQTN